MSRFLNHLQIELVWDDKGLPLYNRDGRQLFQLLSDFAYQSELAKQNIVVPKGFVTDFASIPQAMLSVFGEIAQEPSTIHDYLYSTAPISRELADKILLEAMEVTGISWAKRKLIYAGVRVGGGSHFGIK